MKKSLLPQVLSILILISISCVCPAQSNRNTRISQRAPDPLHDWVTIPVKSTIYPPSARPQEFNSTLAWPNDLQPITPPAQVSIEDQVIVLPNTNYTIKHAKMIMGPPESGLVVVAGEIETFFSGRSKDLGVSVLSLVSLKHGKAITKTFTSEMKAFDISPNGKFLAVTIKPKSGSWLKMNHLLVLRLDDGSFDPIAHYTPFDDAPSVRQRNDTMGILDVLWLNNKQLFVVSEREMGVQLDLTTNTIGFGMYPEKTCYRSPYLLSPDRKYLIAIHHSWEESKSGSDVKGLAIFNAEDGKQLGYLKLSPSQADKTPAALHTILDFSSNGRLMASRGESEHLYVWDFFRGQVIGNHPQSVGEHGVWIKNRFIFGSASGAPYLWDAKDKLLCAKYEDKSNINGFVACEDKLIYLAADDGFHPQENRLICSSVIPTNMDEFLREAARRQERVMGPGDDVSLEFNLRHGSSFQNQIEQYLRKVCKTNNWNVVAPGDTAYRIEAYMTDLEEETEYGIYHLSSSPFDAPLASVKVRPYTVGYSIYRENRLIWKSAWHVTPYGRTVEEFTGNASEIMRSKPDWFLNVTFPETILRGEMESDNRNATITTNGIVFK